MKYHNELNINELRIMYCIFNPMYKTTQAQYKWINKQCLKYAKKHVNSNCSFHFEFSKQRHFSYLTIFFNSQVIKMQCKNSYFINQNLTQPTPFN